jgi:hypothetical protein
MNDDFGGAYEWLIKCFEGPILRKANILIFAMPAKHFNHRFKVDLLKESEFSEDDYAYVYIDKEHRKVIKIYVGNYVNFFQLKDRS